MITCVRMLMSTLTRSASAWAVRGPRNPSLAPPATLAFWTRVRRMPPAAPWARPRVVTTPSPLSYTQPHNNATTPLRWRYLASSLARICDLLMSSLQPWVTPFPHWTCPSALRTLWRLAPTVPSPGWRPNSNTMPPHLAALLRQNISYTPIVWSAYGRPHADTLTVLRSLSKSIARKRNIASAEVVFHRLHSSITLEMWRRSARQIRTCWPVTDLRLSWTWTSSTRRGLFPSTWLSGFCFSRACSCVFFALPGFSPLSWLWLFWPSCAPVMAAPGGLPPWRPRGLALALPVSQHLLPSLSAQLRPLFFFGALCRASCGTMSRGDDLRQLAAQLAMLAALEDYRAGHLQGHGRRWPMWVFSLRRRWPVCGLPQLLQRLWCQPPPVPVLALALPHRCPNGHRGAAPAPSLSRVDPSPSLSRDWSRAWPSRAAHQSLPLSCASPVSLARLLQLRALRGLLVKPLRLPACQTSRPTLTAIGMPSSTHTASSRLPMSLQPPSPSRPTPLELVGALATSAAVACAKLSSAPCGARSKRPCCVSHATWPVLVASLAVVLVLDASTLLRITGEELADLIFSCASGAGRGEGGHLHISEDHADALQDVGFSGAVGAGRGEDALGSRVLEFENSFMAAAEVDSLETLRIRRSPTRAITIPESGCARQS